MEKQSRRGALDGHIGTEQEIMVEIESWIRKGDQNYS